MQPQVPATPAQNLDALLLTLRQLVHDAQSANFWDPILQFEAQQVGYVGAGAVVRAAIAAIVPNWVPPAADANLCIRCGFTHNDLLHANPAHAVVPGLAGLPHQTCSYCHSTRQELLWKCTGCQRYYCLGPRKLHLVNGGDGNAYTNCTCFFDPVRHPCVNNNALLGPFSCAEGANPFGAAQLAHLRELDWVADAPSPTSLCINPVKLHWLALQYYLQGAPATEGRNRSALCCLLGAAVRGHTAALQTLKPLLGIAQAAGALEEARQIFLVVKFTLHAALRNPTQFGDAKRAAMRALILAFLQDPQDPAWRDAYRADGNYLLTELFMRDTPPDRLRIALFALSPLEEHGPAADVQAFSPVRITALKIVYGNASFPQISMARLLGIANNTRAPNGETALFWPFVRPGVADLIAPNPDVYRHDDMPFHVRDALHVEIFFYLNKPARWGGLVMHRHAYSPTHVMITPLDAPAQQHAVTFGDGGGGEGAIVRVLHDFPVLSRAWSVQIYNVTPGAANGAAMYRLYPLVRVCNLLGEAGLVDVRPESQ